MTEHSKSPVAQMEDFADFAQPHNVSSLLYVLAKGAKRAVVPQVPLLCVTAQALGLDLEIQLELGKMAMAPVTVFASTQRRELRITQG